MNSSAPPAPAAFALAREDLPGAGRYAAARGLRLALKRFLADDPRQVANASGAAPSAPFAARTVT